MKYTEEIQNKVNTALKDIPDYPYIAVRSQDVPFTAGETIDHLSSIWIDGDETDDTLDGVSATKIDRMYLYDGDHFQYGYYYGDYVAILGSDNAEYGEDDGELIMIDPVVLAVIS